MTETHTNRSISGAEADSRPEMACKDPQIPEPSVDSDGEYLTTRLMSDEEYLRIQKI